MKKGTIIIEPEILADTRLTWLEKIMLARIAGFCNSSDDGACRLSAAELAEPLALPTYRAQRIIVSLASKGMIVRSWETQNVPVITLGGGDQKGNTPFYIITKDNENNNEVITKTNAHERIISETDMMFSEFWDAYPKKRDKKGAAKAFRNIKHLGNEFPKIIQDVKTKSQSSQWKEQGGRFIPNPTTYIHQERWKESIEINNAALDDPFAELARLREEFGG